MERRRGGWKEREWNGRRSVRGGEEKVVGQERVKMESWNGGGERAGKM
jgi:hypothetical protein